MRRVLLVEDEEEAAALTMREFRQWNFSTAHVKSLVEAFSRIESEEFDCMVLDIGMPDGPEPMEVVASILQINCPVVVYTGLSDPEIVKAVRATGAAYVRKPGIDLLIEEIWSQINFRRGDTESAVRQQAAQQNLRRERPSKYAVVAVIVSMLTMSGGFTSWAWQTFSTRVTGESDIKHRLEQISLRADRVEDMVRKMDSAIEQIRNQNQISIDERRALKENQIELKTDIKERLDRIERKLDTKGIFLPSPAISKPPVAAIP